MTSNIVREDGEAAATHALIDSCARAIRLTMLPNVFESDESIRRDAARCYELAREAAHAAREC